MNVYYTTAHFAVTTCVLVWLFARHPETYRRWRWVLGATTLLALLGFVAYPLMPPRLVTSQFGVYRFEDTLATLGGLWDFEDGAIAKLSNKYAAMPSLHFAWSAWCTAAVWGLLRSPWARALAVAHPVLTGIAIVATGNHWIIDAVAGAAVLGLGIAVGLLIARKVDRRPDLPPLPPSPPSAALPPRPAP